MNGTKNDPNSSPKPDVFADLDKLRLSQDFAETAGVKKLLTTVPVRKPTQQEFVRTHPDDSFRFPAAILELRDDRESYLVSPELWSELPVT